MFESDNVRELKMEGGSAPLQFILALHPLCTFCDYFWNIRLTTPTRQTALTEIDSKCRHISKAKTLADVGHLAGARGPRARRVAVPKLDVGCWQQEGVESHKVATQSSRLACLSRVNIAPRLHTVMTNRGGRAQKHYQDSCLVLPDRTHADPISGKADEFLKSSTWHMKCGKRRRRFRQRVLLVRSHGSRKSPWLSSEAETDPVFWCSWYICADPSSGVAYQPSIRRRENTA